jgi:hypothetical protein
LSQANIWGVDILGNIELRHVRFPVLRVADFWVINNPRLPACEVMAMFALMGGEHEQRLNDETTVCGP